jgi:hypothetical protein
MRRAAIFALDADLKKEGVALSLNYEQLLTISIYTATSILYISKKT